ncbi:hypothetical protein M153_43500001, partial [Pseudoloma neurophilia]
IPYVQLQRMLPNKINYQKINYDSGYKQNNQKLNRNVVDQEKSKIQSKK